MTCTACRLGRLWECRANGNCGDSNHLLPIGNGGSNSSELGNSSNDSQELSGPVREINTYKNDAVLKDQQSTGRKRAAEMYPLDRDAACEWQQSKNCGGGNNPITGCWDGKQEARHHGPDKNTLNNDQGNVHRICHKCHNRWHAKNDVGYVWGGVYADHSPIPCSQEEVMMSELAWMGVKIEHVTD